LSRAKEKRKEELDRTEESKSVGGEAEKETIADR
jgi:hypothetical protein